MAISGGATTAYVCQVHGYELQILARGERCVVAGSDMVALRRRLQQAGVGESGPPE